LIIISIFHRYCTNDTSNHNIKIGVFNVLDWEKVQTVAIQPAATRKSFRVKHAILGTT
jgi:hypothetical protein